MKFRIRVSFEVPSNTSPKEMAQAISKTFQVLQKMIPGEVTFEVPVTNLGDKLTFYLLSSNQPPSGDNLKIRLVGLKGLEIVDATRN